MQQVQSQGELFSMKTDKFLKSDIKKLLHLDDDTNNLLQEGAKNEPLVAYKYPKHVGS